APGIALTDLVDLESDLGPDQLGETTAGRGTEDDVTPMERVVHRHRERSGDHPAHSPRGDEPPAFGLTQLTEESLLKVLAVPDARGGPRRVIAEQCPTADLQCPGETNQGLGAD